MTRQPPIHPFEKFTSLHRYYGWSTVLKAQFYAGLRDIIASKDPKKAIGDYVGPMKLGPGTVFMSYWYAAICVVVEGWQELGYDEPTIDSLLASDHAEHLKRHRNATCHYQSPMLSPKWHAFERRSGAVEWINALDKAFGDWFLARTAENVQHFAQALRKYKEEAAHCAAEPLHPMYEEFLAAVDRGEDPGKVAWHYMATDEFAAY